MPQLSQEDRAVVEAERVILLETVKFCRNGSIADAQSAFPGYLKVLNSWDIVFDDPIDPVPAGKEYFISRQGFPAASRNKKAAVDG